ncbi:MAG: hypothetical protein WC822_02530 [Candidatus Paceibacterota bacterium]|jgi:hypothetical protein
MNKKIIAKFREGENNVLMVSERRSGESKLDHAHRIEMRIDVMKKIMVERPNKKKIKELLENLEKPSKSDQKKIKTLLDEIITAINKWRDECIKQGENPICISNFISMDPKTGRSSPNMRYAIFGEQQWVKHLLKRADKRLNLKNKESESDHEKRIEEMKKIIAESSNKEKKGVLLEKPNRSDKKKIDALLEEVVTAITKWKHECIAQGERPVFITSFISLEPGEELSSHERNVMFGEEPMLMSVLKRTNEMLDPKGGKYSLFKKISG